MKKHILLIILVTLIAIGVAGRLTPHLPNATPITALIFATSIYFGRSFSLMIPLAVLLVTDLIIGFYDPMIMLSVYGSFALIALVSWCTRRNPGILSTGYSVLGSSILFFFVTNTAVWWFSPWYAKSFAGLLYCFELALPFLRNMMLGDLIYTPLILGGLYVLTRAAGAHIGTTVGVSHTDIRPQRSGSIS